VKIGIELALWFA